jgi:Holliday junction resolvase RusA-like endonuclease
VPVVPGEAMTLRIVIPGEPMGKERPRFNPRTGRARTPEKTRKAESDLGWLAKQAALDQGVDLPIDGPVALSLVVYSGRTMRTEALVGKQSADLDNVLKLAMDGLNGIVYQDDSQVVRISATIAHAQANPETIVEIEEEKTLP